MLGCGSGYAYDVEKGDQCGYWQKIECWSLFEWAKWDEVAWVTDESLVLLVYCSHGYTIDG